MAQLETLIVPLKLENESFNRGIQGSITKASAFGTIIGNVAFKALEGLANLAGKGIELVGGFLSEAKNAAVDLSESINAVNVVFEEGAKKIHEFGKTAANTVGLSNAEFNQLSSVTGAFLTNLGFDSLKAADKTIELTKRASDMASVFNTDVSQALAAIQSGLKGEFNPLEQFGVKMNAAAIEAKAMAMGLAETKSELDDNAKAQAALALIMEQTNKLAGDFINTSDGLANGQRILTSRFEDLKAKIGTALLPVLEKLQEKFISLIDSEEFNKLIDRVIKKFEEVSTWILTNIPVWQEKFRVWGESTLDTYNTQLKPVVENLILLFTNLNAITEMLSPSTEKLTGKFTLLGIVQRVAVGVAMSMRIALTLVNDILTVINNTLQKVINRTDAFKNAVWALASALARLSIPWWLTPGSPTPLENGLRGIDSAMKSINSKSLPEFKGGLDINNTTPAVQPIDYNKLARVLTTAVSTATG